MFPYGCESLVTHFLSLAQFSDAIAICWPASQHSSATIISSTVCRRRHIVFPTPRTKAYLTAHRRVRLHCKHHSLRIRWRNATPLRTALAVLSHSYDFFASVYKRLQYKVVGCHNALSVNPTNITNNQKRYFQYFPEFLRGAPSATHARNHVFVWHNYRGTSVKMVGIQQSARFAEFM